MKYLMAFLLLLVVVVSVVPLLAQDPGHVVIVYSDVSIETTLSFFLIVLLLGMLVLVLAFRLLKLALGFPDLMYQRGQQRHRERHRLNFNHGLTELASGHWKNAEKLLVSSFEHGGDQLLSCLGAARAAQHQGEHERRDQYLKQAHRVSRQAELPTGLTQAELQIRQGQNERALATLNHLGERFPANPYLLELQLQLYLQLGEWVQLKAKLPLFVKAGLIDQSRASELEVESSLQILRKSASQGGVEKILSDWGSLSEDLRINVDLVKECAGQLLALGEHEHAEVILRHAIERHWNTGLVALYGQVMSKDAQSQMRFADGWNKELTEDASVQLALARLCLHNQLLGKARFHLEASVEMGGEAEAYFELASLLEQLNDFNAAQRCYQEGLTRVVGAD